jgi:hypothetical protein
MAVVACGRRLRRAARRAASRAIALAILALLFGAGTVHGTALGVGTVHGTMAPQPTIAVKVASADQAAASSSTKIAPAPAAVDDEIVAELELRAVAAPITGPQVEFPGDVARSSVLTRAPPQLLAA